MANVKNLLDTAETAIKDFFDSKFELSFTNARNVPTYEDCDLTFERQHTKYGKEIDTCVLFVDIRDSVALNSKHQKDTMAKLYAAFVKAVIYAANHHNGAVRNIIGDRVMVVFQPQDCFINAVECAISINKICNTILNKYFKLSNIRCGIGIDWGNMRVIKVGTHRQGAERASSKNLIWVGDPANIASRLTDIANKETITKKVEYTVEQSQFLSPYTYLLPILRGQNYKPNYNPPIKTPITNSVKPDEFISSLIFKSGELFIKGKFGIGQDRLLSFKHLEEQSSNPPILMTEKVYLEYRKAKPQASDIVSNWCKEQIIDVKDYKGKIFGGSVIWKT